jgi:hypothetical protein
MKRLLIAFTLVFSLFSVAPKANAGLVVGLIAGAPGAGAAIGVGAGTAFTLVALIAQEGDDLGEGVILLFSPLIVTMGTLLDVDSSLSQGELYSAFRKKYTFIDNHEALASLSDTVIEKISHISEAELKAKTYVSLSREEVAAALETADISQAQFEQIANDLK